MICSPLVEADLERAVDLLKPLPNGKVLELGCGKAEILARIVEATGSTGTGVDLPESLAAELSPRAATLKDQGRLEIQFKDALDFVKETTTRYDILIVSGASQSLGGFEQLGRVVKRLLKPNGKLLLGELGWRESPFPAFLEAMKMRESDLPYTLRVPEQLVPHGLRSVFWSEISRSQFLQYEKALLENGANYARSRPKDPEARKVGEYSSSWFNLMEEGGGRFFSFGWGLFQN